MKLIKIVPPLCAPVLPNLKEETVEDIIKEIRNEWATLYFSEGGRTRNGEYPNTVCIETDVLADRIEAAWRREKTKENENEKN